MKEDLFKVVVTTGKQKKELLGELEEITLLALIKLGSESYGVPIHETVEDASERFISIGSIYATLDRLERNGRGYE